MSALVTKELIQLDVNWGSTKTDVISHLIELVSLNDRTTNHNEVKKAALAREVSSPTGLPGGAAIPHCRSPFLLKPTLVFTRLHEPVDFGGSDGPSDLIFFIGVPASAAEEHSKILSRLARGLLKKSFTAGLRGAETVDDALNILNMQLQSAANTAPFSSVNSNERCNDNSVEVPKQPVRVVAITSCPTGIAHTYLAADALRKAAYELGGTILSVETQGSTGTKPVSDECCKNAEVVICAAAIAVHGLDRFTGADIIKTPIGTAVNDPEKLLLQAIELAHRRRDHRVHSKQSSLASGPRPEAAVQNAPLQLNRTESVLYQLRDAVLTGVSFMIPFVAASGLLLALGYLLGGHTVAEYAEHIARNFNLWQLPSEPLVLSDGSRFELPASPLLTYFASILYVTGTIGMAAIVPILSAFIAFGLSGRPGIAPGFIGGAISVTVGAGFIGGLVTGILSGFIVAGLLKVPLPRWLASLMPVVIVPLIGTLSIGLLMYVLLGSPLAAIFTQLQAWLAGIHGASALVVGLILGAMMCTDMGGPINKAAYLFATAGLSTGDSSAMGIMAVVMAAGMVPPLATSLAAALRPTSFSVAEQQNAKAGWLLGASFISEGAIPFAAKDPLRVLPSLIIGGAVTGAISMLSGAATRAPHGGVFVLFTISQPAWWLFSIVAGSIVSSFCILLLKRYWPQRREAAAYKQHILASS